MTRKKKEKIGQGLFEQIKNYGNKVTYKPPSRKNVEIALSDLFKNRDKNRGNKIIKLYGDADQCEHMSASVAYSITPTEENRIRLDTINKKLIKSLEERDALNKKRFIEIYGQEMYDFVYNLSDSKYPNNNDYYHFYVYEDDEVDAWAVRFYKGKFDFILQYSGGYAGTDILESDISKERVLTILNKN